MYAEKDIEDALKRLEEDDVIDIQGNKRAPTIKLRNAF